MQVQELIFSIDCEIFFCPEYIVISSTIQNIVQNTMQVQELIFSIDCEIFLCPE